MKSCLTIKEQTRLRQISQGLVTVKKKEFFRHKYFKVRTIKSVQGYNLD